MFPGPLIYICRSGRLNIHTFDLGTTWRTKSYPYNKNLSETVYRIETYR